MRIKPVYIRDILCTAAVVALLLSMFSCGSKKDVVYFQHPEKVFGNSKTVDSATYEPRIVINDNLLISVYASNPEAVKQYNKYSQSSGQLSASARNLEYSGFLVDKQGDIKFPVLGKLHVEGLTRTEAEDMIVEKLSATVEDPTVDIRFLNFRIIMLGDIAAGVYDIPSERISIVEAIALAGDLNLTGQRKDVRIFRVENGEKKTFTVDLTDPELFFSPYYYLQQNDIVYVTPNSTKARNSSSLMPLLSIGMTLFSTALTLYYFISGRD
jgi:polysaccharide export outer membrane protein